MRSDLLLRCLALAIALGVLVVVHGEKQASVIVTLPVIPSLPAGLAPAAPLPGEVRVAISGPWARLRTLDAGDLGPVPLEVGAARPGAVSWYVRPEALHLPRGLRVDGTHPSQGMVELVPQHPAGPPADGSGAQP